MGQFARLSDPWKIYVFFTILLFTGTLIVFRIYFITLTKGVLDSNSDNTNKRYSYYVCTQIYDEPEHYLIDWLDHQFNVVGFRNVCVINTGKPVSRAIRDRFHIAYVEKSTRAEEFQYCLSSCFIDEPMRPEDMLMIQDTDEYLNIRQADVVFRNYHKYEMFHFTEVRYGFVLDKESEIVNQSIRNVNSWRKPHSQLGEYVKQDLKDLFKCKTYDGWPSCEEGNGKEMIRVGSIQSLDVHFQSSKLKEQRRLHLEMKDVRLNHYMMRTREDAEISAKKWNKFGTRVGQIATNAWFRIVFDDTILQSKKLL